MRDLFFHIGTHKTGSSAIQAALSNVDAPGLVYPQSGQISTGGHLNLAWEVSGDPRHRAKRGTTKELLAEVRESAARSVVISAETLSTRSDEGVYVDWASDLVTQLGPERVTVIAYVRPQWDYLESMYTQAVKSGATGRTFDAFSAREVKRELYDYSRVMAPWDAQFGASVLVRPYGSDVVRDLFGLVGLPYLRKSGRVNARPGALEIEMLRRLYHDVTTSAVDRVALFDKARKWLSNALSSDIPFRGLSADQTTWLYKRFRDSNEKLADRFWHGVLPESFVPGDDAEHSTALSTDVDEGLYADLLKYIGQIESREEARTK